MSGVVCAGGSNKTNKTILAVSIAQGPSCFLLLLRGGGGGVGNII